MTAGGGHVPEAVVFGSDGELTDVVAPFLLAGLDAGDAVLLVCAEHRAALLRDALGHDPRLLALAPLQVYRRPAYALSHFHRLVERHAAGGRRIRIVGDADHGHRPADWSEWARFEAVVHHVLARYPLRSICLLDRREAPEQVLAAAGRTHPTLWNFGTRGRSPGYAHPEDVLRRYGYVRDDPLEHTGPRLRLEEVTNLSLLRQAVATELAGRRLPPWQVHEFVVAVSEVAANAIRHGRPPVRVRLWATPARVLCTVTDHGAGFALPMSSYVAGDPGRGGLGLYLARQLCDQLNVSWTPDGATVRLALLLQ